MCFVFAVPVHAAVDKKVRVTGDARLTEESGERVGLSLEKTSGRAVVVLDYTEAPLDLSAFRDIAIPIQNGTDSELDVLVNATSDRRAEWLRSTSGRFLVRSAEEMDLTVLMTRPDLGPDHPYVKRLGDLHAFPWGYQQHWRHMNASAVSEVTLRLKWNHAAVGQTVEIGRARGFGTFRTDPAALETLEMPLVDPFGQLRVGEWPGKVKAASELQEDKVRDRDLVATVTKPGAGRSRFGGMTGGPALKATGFFRVEKINGSWWFVDPDGNLFWSLGVNCAGSSVQTRVKGREELFSEEDRSEPTASHYWKNVKRKFGEEDWRNRHTELIQARMFDWGLNTVGAWSIPETSATGRIPYTLIVHPNLQQLGKVKKIADPFSESFTTSLERNLKDLAATHANSPWLLGVFIDNELDWQGGHELVKEIIRSYKDAPARVALLKFLESRYGDVSELNKAWNTDFNSFAEIRATPGPLGEKKFAKDLDDFLAVFADRYFTVCKETMRRTFPNHLYLGCRFNQFNPIITAAASRHCDVISLNIYQHSFESFRLITDEDRPWIISEFHFGMRDHGVWGTGLTWAADGRNQADLFQAYVSDALRHPNIVGAHWFAWTSQTVTGRGDGENFGVGFVTVVDRPVEPLIGAVRNVSDHLYPYRLGDSQGRIGEGSSIPSGLPEATGKVPKP